MTTTQTTDINTARTLANIAHRAETLFADGYKAELFACGCYHVDGPEGQHYMTTCDEVMGHHCTCPAFAKFNECKHHLAIAKEIAEGEQADRDWERAEEVANFFNGRYDF